VLNFLANQDKQWSWIRGGAKVQYLDAAERAQHAITLEEGKFYGANGKLFSTTSSPNERAIFVMDEHGNIFASTSYEIGEFHHSSFLGGRPVAAAGEIEVHNGVLLTLSDRSGHYAPSREFTNQAIDVMKNQGVDMSFVYFDFHDPPVSII
jgi:hypothetical protein